MADNDDAALFDATVSGSAPADTAAPAPAQSPEPAPAAPVANRDPASGKFASKPSVPEITSAAPAAPAEPEGNGMVPQQALHESRQREQAERGRADRLEQALLALQKPATPAAPVEQPKPVELWDDPDKWGASLVETKLTPLQEEIANTRAFYSDRDAVREHGAELVTAAKAALGEAIKSGTMNDAQVTAHLKRSMDPVGEIIAWHKGNLNQQRIGNDPDAFVQAEIEKLVAAGTLSRTNAPAAAVDASSKPANRTVIPPSLSRLGSPANDSAGGGIPSDTELFESVTGAR